MPSLLGGSGFLFLGAGVIVLLWIFAQVVPWPWHISPLDLNQDTMNGLLTNAGFALVLLLIGAGLVVSGSVLGKRRTRTRERDYDKRSGGYRCDACGYTWGQGELLG